jgi:hypothetical protein
MNKKPLPQTDAEWAAERCRLSCKIGKDALNRVVHCKEGYETQYAIYNLLSAVEELSKQIAHEAKASKDTK